MIYGEKFLLENSVDPVLEEVFTEEGTPVNEAFWLLHSETRKVHKDINKKVNEYSKFKLNLFNNKNSQYNPEVVKKIDSFLESYFTKLQKSNVIKTIWTDQYGAQTIYFEKYYVGLKGDYIYQFFISFRADRATLGGAFSCLPVSKCILDEKMIKFVLDNAKAGSCILRFGKKSVSYKKAGQDGTDYTAPYKLYDLIKKKLGEEYKCKESLTGTLKIKKA